MNAETSRDLRRLADECRVRADLSQSSAQEQWWLEMAANWAAMAEERMRAETCDSAHVPQVDAVE